jgi:hypothetical protein
MISAFRTPASSNLTADKAQPVSSPRASAQADMSVSAMPAPGSLATIRAILTGVHKTVSGITPDKALATILAMLVARPQQRLERPILIDA